MPLSANRRSAPQRGAESMGGLRLTCTWGHLQQTYNTQSLKHNHANVLCLGKTFTRNRLIERVAETVAEACTREQRPQTARRAVKAIGQDAADPIRRLLLERCLLKRAV